MSLPRTILSSYTRTPATGWEIDIPNRPYINFHFPESGLFDLLRIRIKDDGTFGLYIRACYNEEEGKFKNLIDVINIINTNLSYPENPAHQSFEPTYHFKVESKDLLIKLLRDLCTQHFIPESIVDDVKLTWENTASMLQELMPAYDVLSHANGLYINANNKDKLNEASLYETSSVYSREEFNRILAKAIDQELIGFFKYRKEFESFKLCQLALKMALQKGKLAVINFLFPEKKSFSLLEIELAFASQNKTFIKHVLAFVEIDNGDITEHDLLQIAAKINKEMLTLLLQEKPAISLKRHLDTQNTECDDCKYGYSILREAIKSNAPSINDKPALIEYLVAGIELAQAEWERLLALAQSYCGIKIENILRNAQHPQNAPIVLSLPVLFKKFITPAQSPEFYQEIALLIEEYQPHTQTLSELAQDASVLAGMLFYYSSRFSQYPDKLESLLDLYPDALHTKNAEGGTLLWNTNCGFENHQILKMLLSRGADPYLPNGSGISLLGFLEKDKRNYYSEWRCVSDFMLLEKISKLKKTFPDKPELSARILSFDDESYRNLFFGTRAEREKMQKDFEGLVESFFKNPADPILSKQLVQQSYLLEGETKAAQTVMMKLWDYANRTNYRCSSLIPVSQYLEFKNLLAAAEKISEILIDNHLSIEDAHFGRLSDVIQSYHEKFEAVKPQIMISLYETFTALFENPEANEQVNKFKELAVAMGNKDVSVSLDVFLHDKAFRPALKKLLQNFVKVEKIFCESGISIAASTLKLVKELRIVFHKEEAKATYLSKQNLWTQTLTTCQSGTENARVSLHLMRK